MADVDKKLEVELARINAEFDKRIAAALDISNDAALEVCEGDRDACPRPASRSVSRRGFTATRGVPIFFFSMSLRLSHACAQPATVLETGFTSCVVVENVPVVDDGPLLGRLTTLISQIFGRCGKIAEDGIYLPVDPKTKKTLGFCIVQYLTEEQAKTAVKALDKFPLDKAHTFRVSPYSVLVTADNTPDDYVQPEVALAEKPNLHAWLLDARGADQFVVRYDQTVEVDWNTFDYTKTWNDPAQRLPEPYWRKDAWQVGFCGWSPRGSYLATAHPNGIVLWGGPAPFDKPLGRFEHLGVSKFDFSPNEKFLVTASAKAGVKADDIKEDDPKTVIFHDVATGKRKLEFTGVRNFLPFVIRVMRNKLSLSYGN
jgi:translation initiation factor 3 subunit B